MVSFIIIIISIFLKVLEKMIREKDDAPLFFFYSFQYFVVVFSSLFLEGGGVEMVDRVYMVIPLNSPKE